jgi:hypothetical protein
MADLATNFPTSPSFNAVNFKINTPSQITESFSGKIRRVGLGISYYSWEVKFPNLTGLEAGSITGYISQALGQQFSFQIILPKISYTKITAATVGGAQTSNTVVVSGTMARGSTSVTLTNCGANKNVLAAGDFFKFNNHSKVYMCVSPCVANGSGVATLYFSCPAVTSVPSSTQLTITAVPFTAILAEPEQSWDTGYGGITTMTLAMREVWGN